MRHTIIHKYICLLILLFALGSCSQGQDEGPTAVIIGPETVEVGHVFSIDGTTSFAGKTPITTYAWDLGDGGIAYSPTVNYSYGSSGEYELTLTVIDETGSSHTVQQTIQVTQIAEGTPPTAVIDGPTTALVGETVTLYADNSEIGSNAISKFNWQSGDGEESGDTINAAFTTSYEQPGTFYPMVILFDNQGLSDSVSMEIIILETGP